jgi:hypothetical protein
MTEWPVPASTNLADIDRAVEIRRLQIDLRETGALPFNGVTIVSTDEIMELLEPSWGNPVKLSGEFTKPIHKCVTPDLLWERMAPSLELRNEDGDIWSYSEFEGYAIELSHLHFPGTDRNYESYCDSCDCLRMIWLRYQLTAAIVEFEMDDSVHNDGNENRRWSELLRAIQYELEIACDPESPASPNSNHPAGKAE